MIEMSAAATRKLPARAGIASFPHRMDFLPTKIRCSRLAALAWLALAAFATAQERVLPPKKADLRAEPMVELSQVCPSIVIELRYGTARNVTGKPIYPPNARCLVRRSVAERLKKAQAELQAQKLGLKIWDAYRPAWAQQILWDAIRNPEYVGEPARGGSLHAYGVGVDATLVDAKGREMLMPTDFDDFTPAARRIYTGTNPVIANNLLRLQGAMVRAGFWTLRDEWWHFVAEDVKSFGPVEIALVGDPKPALEEKAPASPPASGSEIKR